MRLLTKFIGYFAIALTLAAFVGCERQSNVDESFTMYYSGVSDISPGTSINVSPSWHGDAPASFEIIRIKHNGRAYETGCFVVNPDTGVFSIKDSETLPTGKYVISVACTSSGKRYTYDDAIEVNIMKPVPDGIIATPATLEVALADIVSGEAELPVSQITTDGSNHVTIKQFSLAHVYRDGDLADECLEWFSLSPKGEFSIVPGTAAFLPGVYTFDFHLTTYIVGKDDEEGLFKKALKLNVTSAPLELTYPAANGKVEKGYGGRSGVPFIKGSQEGLRFTLKGVTPNNAPGITVDDATGVIKFPETDNVTIGDNYSVSVSVANAYGSADFSDVFSFTVTAFIHPITKLEYANIAEVISGVSFSNPVTAVDGDDVTFALQDLPEGLNGVKIDANTGTVSCAKGVELVPGTYNVTVLARNVKTEVTATFSLTVVPNPYKFTYVRWGNNLGLTPIEEYGNQFRIKESDGTLTLPIVESDIPDGVPVKFSIANKTNNSNMKTGASIDAATGTVTIEYMGNQTADRSARVHGSIITVTVGGSSEAAVTMKIPFFISHEGFCKGYKIEYTPFAFRVNPKKGGVSVSPVITRSDGGEVSGVTLSYRRNVYFYNVDGPESHIDGRAQDGKDRLMYTVWNKYFSARNALVNTGSCSPVSYYGDRNGERGWLGLTACYINPDDLTMVVNPDKFSDDAGYASGIVMGTMQYNINNIDPVNTGGTECFPLIIWLDPTYNK